MQSERTIKSGIESLVTTYSLWAIGSTDDPDQREIDTGKPFGWYLFDAANEKAATNVEKHFVRKGMEDDVDVFVTAGKFVYIFMGLQHPPESSRSFHRSPTGSGLSIPDTASLNERFLADFETLYGKRPDYDFLQGIYSQVIADRHPDCTSVAELLAMLFQRLDSMGMDVVGLG